MKIQKFLTLSHFNKGNIMKNVCGICIIDSICKKITTKEFDNGYLEDNSNSTRIELTYNRDRLSLRYLIYKKNPLNELDTLYNLKILWEGKELYSKEKRQFNCPSEVK